MLINFQFSNFQFYNEGSHNTQHSKSKIPTSPIPYPYSLYKLFCLNDVLMSPFLLQEIQQ